MLSLGSFHSQEDINVPDVVESISSQGLRWPVTAEPKPSYCWREFANGESILTAWLDSFETDKDLLTQFCGHDFFGEWNGQTETSYSHFGRVI